MAYDYRVGTFVAPTTPGTLTFDTGLGALPTALVFFCGPPAAVNTLYDGIDVGIGYCDSALNQFGGGGKFPWASPFGPPYWWRTQESATAAIYASEEVDVPGIPGPLIVHLNGIVTALHAGGTVDLNFTVANDLVGRTIGFIAFAGVPSQCGSIPWTAPGPITVATPGFNPAAILLSCWRGSNSTWSTGINVTDSFYFATPCAPTTGAHVGWGVGLSTPLDGNGNPTVGVSKVDLVGAEYTYPPNTPRNPFFASSGDHQFVITGAVPGTSPLVGYLALGLDEDDSQMGTEWFTGTGAVPDRSVVPFDLSPVKFLMVAKTVQFPNGSSPPLPPSISNIGCADFHGNQLCLFLVAQESTAATNSIVGCGIFNDRVYELAHPTLITVPVDGSGTPPHEYSKATLDMSDPTSIKRIWTPSSFVIGTSTYTLTSRPNRILDFAAVGLNICNIHMLPLTGAGPA